MVVTKTPSEPFSVVQKTLIGMLSQSYPHDTWIADEDPSPNTLDWCKENGVKVSSRKGHSEYHRSTWPRRTRCKEGNLAFFYDHFGYRDYDFVVQMDADHVPQEGYLEEMLRPFCDPAVGYVSAPSVCDSNASESWPARARLYGEALFHGALKRVTLINLPQFVLARKASEVLGWMPQCSDLAAIITDAWRWHNKRFGSKGL